MKRKKTNRLRNTMIAAIFLVVAALVVPTAYNAILKWIYPLTYGDIVAKYSKTYELDPNLIMGIIKAESNFDANAVSDKGAKGLMQITETTGEWIAGKIGLESFQTEDLFKPTINIRLGCWYVNYLSSLFDGDLDLAILAYNAGSGNVKSWLEDDNYTDSEGNLIKIPFGETDEFLKRVKGNAEKYKLLYKEGIS